MWFKNSLKTAWKHAAKRAKSLLWLLRRGHFHAPCNCRGNAVKYRPAAQQEIVSGVVSSVTVCFCVLKREQKDMVAEATTPKYTPTNA